MKLITVTCLILIAGVEIGYSNDSGATEPSDDSYSIKLHEDINYLETHDCVIESEKTTNIIQWSGMKPCLDTPGCRLPQCCGIIAGRPSIFALNFTAGANLTTGSFYGLVGGVALGDAANDPLRIYLPVTVLVPGMVASYDHDVCNSAKCPQTIGDNVQLWLKFQFPLSAVTSVSVMANFVAQIYTENRKLSICTSLFARLINYDFIPSLMEVLKNPLDPMQWLPDVLGPTFLGIDLLSLIPKAGKQ